MFVVGYLTNFFTLMGLSFYFVTSTFFDDNRSITDPDRFGVTLPEIQVVLLVTACMYFILGSTLEYVRDVDSLLIIPIVVFFGVMKILVRR